MRIIELFVGVKAVFKKKADNFNSLSADEATRLLGDYYLEQLSLLVDKNKGTIRTAFGILAGAYHNASQMKRLLDVVLDKNGIKKIQADGPVCHDYLPEIIATVEARGSKAAEGLKTYKDLTIRCDREFERTEGSAQFNQYQKIKTKFKICKALDIT